MVYKIIQELKSTRSRNEKEAILSANVDNDDLKLFFRLALSPAINFYQKKTFVQNQSISDNFLNLNSAMRWLEHTLPTRMITGNLAIERVQEVIDKLSQDDAKVVMHILQKESGCDLGASTVNKIWKNLIPEFPNLLATAYTEKLALKLNWTNGVYSQLKSDGGRVSVIVENDGAVSVFSRAGNELNVFGSFDFLGENFKGSVIDGELLIIMPDGKFASRQVSNGIFNKCVRNTLSLDESKNLHITAWDVINLEHHRNSFSPVTYHERFLELESKLVNVDPLKVSLIKSKIVSSLEEAQAHYAEELSRGEEGTMIKDKSMPWEDKRSKLQLKLKSTEFADMEVIGFKEGVGEFEGNLGSLVVASSCRKVVVNMSGFSLKLRSEIYANLIGTPVNYVMVVDGDEKTFTANVGDTEINIGSIIEIAYNQKIKGKNTDTWSLFLPRFEKVRLDKTNANSFDELK